MQSHFPTFLRYRAFLLLKESRHAEETPHDVALHAARAPVPPNSGGGNDNNNRPGGGGRGGGRGRGKGKASGGGGPSQYGGAAAPPRPAAPAPWTGMVHAWPTWRPHAPGAGILGPRPGGPSPFAGVAAQYGVPPPPASTPPAHWHYDAVPPHPVYGLNHDAPPAAPPQAWDQAALVQALNAKSVQQGQTSSSSGGDWILDSGATSHMASSSGSKNEGGDPPL
ncbi:hypothetical protein ACQJBY_044659 [Aegilops geniculata]